MASSWAARQRKRKLSGKNINSELSIDIIQLIFSKLNFVNLCSCRAVCNSWNKLILNRKSYNPNASINSHFMFALISHCISSLHCVDLDPKHLNGIDIVAKFRYHLGPFFSPIKIFNSCHGLLLCSSKAPSVSNMFRDVVCIFNHITSEYIKVFYPKQKEKEYYRYWLGFAPKTKIYKIIRCSFTYKDMDTLPIMSMQLLKNVLAFGTDCYGKWTPVECATNILQDHGTYFDGALYWVGRRSLSVYIFAIYRFDLEDEKFDEISIPQFKNSSERHPFNCFLGFMNDSLYLTFQLSPYGDYQVWQMGEDSLWIKAFVVHCDHFISSYYDKYYCGCLQLIKTCQDGKILCFYNRSSYLMLYDPKTKTTQIFQNQDDQIVKRRLELYEMSCFSFDPLHKILARDPC